MKVPSLMLSCIFLAIDKDGKTHEIRHDLVTGCWEMCQYLKKHFNIDTVPSTVYNGKKLFSPVKYPYEKTKEYYLAYLNWVINCPKEEKADFFDNELDKSKFYDNNPIVDIKIKIAKTKYK